MAKEQPSREELAAAMRRDSRGMRDLRDFLESIKDHDDAAFAEATDGADRAEMTKLLAKLTSVLAETDKLIDKLYEDAKRLDRK
jgi:hypothetical protein